MDFFKKQLNFDFMRIRRYSVGFTLFLVLVSLLSLAIRGLNLGIDFTGGTLIEVSYPVPVEPQQIRDVLEQAQFKDVIVQHYGTVKDIMIRLATEEGASSSAISTRVMTALQATGAPELRRVEFVGAQVGQELTEQGGIATLIAMIGIFIYVALRFEKRFALGAVVATLHDVIITVGFFSVFGIEFDLTVLAAVLAVIGYSLNDTIVVFDRIRENFRKMRREDVMSVMNAAINQTLSRTIMTSFTTMLTMLALFFFGGEVMRGFSLAMIVGIAIGTYSSIYVASATALSLGVSLADLMPVKKEGADVDARP